MKGLFSFQNNNKYVHWNIWHLFSKISKVQKPGSCTVCVLLLIHHCLQLTLFKSLRCQLLKKVKSRLEAAIHKINDITCE